MAVYHADSQRELLYRTGVIIVITDVNLSDVHIAVGVGGVSVQAEVYSTVTTLINSRTIILVKIVTAKQTGYEHRVVGNIIAVAFGACIGNNLSYTGVVNSVVAVRIIVE